MPHSGPGLHRSLLHCMHIVGPGRRISAATEIRAEKSFAIDHAICRALLKQSPGQARIVLRGLQHRGRRLIDLQKMGKTPENT